MRQNQRFSTTEMYNMRRGVTLKRLSSASRNDMGEQVTTLVTVAKGVSCRLHPQAGRLRGLMQGVLQDQQWVLTMRTPHRFDLLMGDQVEAITGNGTTPYSETFVVQSVTNVDGVTTAILQRQEMSI